MIKPELAKDGGGVIRVDCDVCIGGVFFVPYQQGEMPTTAGILAVGKENGWDTENVNLLRCPACVADGWTNPA